jgi:hypothetical protein
MKEFLQIKTHEGKNVYYLSAKGKELVGAENEAKWSLQVDHHLLRNDMYLHYYCPKDWRIEEPIQFIQGLTQHVLIPDATFTLQGKFYFLEVDKTQSMSKNKEKIETYSKLTPLIERKYNHVPTLIFYTVTPLRKEKLNEYCKENKVNCLIYTKEDIR